ncbi:MAG: hypothetical protein JST54_00780 [Deltaproteobacteria bacterium]|nr:hypothetical protein [Deltaproteobacteria bacterium]
MRTLLLTAVLLAASADDVAAKYGLQPVDLHSAIFSNITGDTMWVPMPTSQLRALDGKGRAAAIEALGALAREYVKSADFKQRYAAWRKDQVGDAPPKPKSYDQALKEQKAQVAKMAKDMEEQIKKLPPDAQANARDALKGIVNDPSRYPDRSAYDKMVKDQYEEALNAYKARDAKYPADPKPLIKGALQRFLDGTSDVDFNAKVADAGGHKVFESDDYERKPELWKRAFRAGPEATQAARKIATEWLKELK